MTERSGSPARRRGRPRSVVPKTALSVRVPLWEYELWQAAARRLDLTVVALVRQTVTERCHEMDSAEPLLPSDTKSAPYLRAEVRQVRGSDRGYFAVAQPLAPEFDDDDIDVLADAVLDWAFLNNNDACFEGMVELLQGRHDSAAREAVYDRARQLNLVGEASTALDKWFNLGRVSQALLEKEEDERSQREQSIAERLNTALAKPRPLPAVLHEVRLNADQRLLLAALCESRLRNPAGPLSLPTNKEVALRLGWSLAKLGRKLDWLCERYARAGVDGLQHRGGRATERRLRLVEHVVETGAITSQDLGLLPAPPP